MQYVNLKTDSVAVPLDWTQTDFPWSQNLKSSIQSPVFTASVKDHLRKKISWTHAHILLAKHLLIISLPAQYEPNQCWVLHFVPLRYTCMCTNPNPFTVQTICLHIWDWDHLSNWPPQNCQKSNSVMLDLYHVSRTTCLWRTSSWSLFSVYYQGIWTESHHKIKMDNFF